MLDQLNLKRLNEQVYFYGNDSKLLWFDLKFYDKDSDTCIQYLNSNPFKMTKTLNTNMAFVQGFFWTTL